MSSSATNFTVYHGAMLAGMLGGALLFFWQMRRLKVGWRRVLCSFLIAVALPVAGARIVDVWAYAPKQWHRIQLLDVFGGGLSSHGAILGLMVLTAVLAYLYHLPVRVIADRLLLWALVGVAVTRVADHALGQGMGTPTDLPWAIDSGGGLMRHPTHFYEIGVVTVLFALAIALRRRFGTSRPGASAALVMLFYFALRLLLDAMREVAPMAEGSSIAMGQALSAPLVVIFALLTGFWLRLTHQTPIVQTTPPSATAKPLTGPRSMGLGLLAALITAGILGALAQQVVTNPQTLGGHFDQWRMAALSTYVALWAVPLVLLSVPGYLLGRLLERWQAQKPRIVVTTVLILFTIFAVVFLMLFAGTAPAAGAWVALAVVLPFRSNSRDFVVFVITGAGALAVSQFVRPLVPDLFPRYISGPMIPIYFGLAGTLTAWVFEKIASTPKSTMPPSSAPGAV